MAAEQGFTDAQFNLTDSDNGVAPDAKQGVSCYREAASQGDATASFALGTSDYEGKGVVRDLDPVKICFVKRENLLLLPGLIRGQFGVVAWPVDTRTGISEEDSSEKASSRYVFLANFTLPHPDTTRFQRARRDNSPSVILYGHRRQSRTIPICQFYLFKTQAVNND